MSFLCFFQFAFGTSKCNSCKYMPSFQHCIQSINSIPKYSMFRWIFGYVSIIIVAIYCISKMRIVVVLWICYWQISKSNLLILRFSEHRWINCACCHLWLFVCTFSNTFIVIRQKSYTPIITFTFWIWWVCLCTRRRFRRLGWFFILFISIFSVSVFTA